MDGREFKIETDHKPLLLFNTKQQLNSKCERWRLKLQQYKFSIWACSTDRGPQHSFTHIISSIYQDNVIFLSVLPLV